MADKYIVSKDKLTALGDAVREKAGTEDKMTLDQMTTAVSNISTGSSGGVDEFYKKVATNAWESTDTDVTLPDDMTTAQSCMLYNNDKVETLRLNNLVNVPISFINGRSSNATLKAIYFTDKQKQLGSYAFVNCSALEYIEIPYGADITIHAEAFRNSGKSGQPSKKFGMHIYGNAIAGDDSSNSLNNFKMPIILYSENSMTILNSGFLNYYGNFFYVPYACLDQYKNKTNFVGIADRIKPIPKYISYTLSDTSVKCLYNSEEVTSPVATNGQDSETLTFLADGYDIKSITTDLSATDFFDTKDIGTVTLTQNNPIFTLNIPENAIATVTYQDAKFTQSDTSSTYRVKASKTVDIIVTLPGYRKYKTTHTMGASDETLTITTADMTALQKVDVDLVTPFTDTYSLLGNLADGSNFEVNTTEGAIQSGSNSYHVNNGSSYGYITINTPSSVSELSITYKVSSEYNYDVGYVKLTNTVANNTAYVDVNDAKRAAITSTTDFSSVFTSDESYLLERTNSNSSTHNSYYTKTVTLPANKTLYLGFGYIKDSSENNGDDRFYIKEVKFTEMI